MPLVKSLSKLGHRRERSPGCSAVHCVLQTDRAAVAGSFAGRATDRSPNHHVDTAKTLSPSNRAGLEQWPKDVYTHIVRANTLGEQSAAALFALPCACQNLRRVTRVVTRVYDQELRTAGLEITQFGLLAALAETGEAYQKRLSAGFALDSTTLTRTLMPLLNEGWVRVRRGEDRRARLFSLTNAGRRKMAEAQPYWERAERRLRRELGEAGWKKMKRVISRMTEAAMAA